jgi:glycosyltransferase involved in cell wall biosynthesis
MVPLVTFVVPCYNYGRFLSECINSILMQSYCDFEVLILDNCSTDNTAEIATSIRDPRVKYLRNEVNIGHVRNFNKGVSMARGKYVWLLAADDYLCSSKALQRFVELMERNSDLGLVFCRSFEVRGTTELGLAWWTDCGDRDRIWRGSSFLRRLVQSDCVVMSSALMRKDSCAQAGALCPDLPHACDWYLCLRIALRNSVAYFADAMVASRTHQESVTALLNQAEVPLCTLDELNVLWRVAREAEEVGLGAMRSACNTSIAGRSARALRPRKPGARPGLSKQDLEALVRANARDASDQDDIWARIYTILGDEQYWDGEPVEAARSYRKALTLRPWNIKIRAKVALLATGKFGTGMREVYASLAVVTKFKKHPRRPGANQAEPEAAQAK